jgi:hypothetical protein
MKGTRGISRVLCRSLSASIYLLSSTTSRDKTRAAGPFGILMGESVRWRGDLGFTCVHGELFDSLFPDT